mmetsp:Transcript_33101/g.51574  ORF Transcript_33101/g.51574 Transcript_33101/m.51574 type:complete len:203 (-) Transcript_33101:267-875(-)
MSVKIGVLALQGDFAEHIATFKKCKDVECAEIRKSEQLEGLNALVIPGGESTVMTKLLNDFKMYDDVRNFGLSGTPMFGTCAGCIMLSKDIDKMPEQKTLDLIDMTVSRNAYGPQVNSFESEITGDEAVTQGQPIRAVLIRAPMIMRAGSNTKTLASHDSNPVLLQQGNLLACTFHPEITGDTRIHQYFVNVVREHNKPFKP